MRAILLLVFVLLFLSVLGCSSDPSDSDIQTAIIKTLVASERDNIDNAATDAVSESTSTATSSIPETETPEILATSPSPPLTQPPTSPPVVTVPLRILPYEYILEDQGDGWSIGTVYFAVENIGDSPISEEWFNEYSPSWNRANLINMIEPNIDDGKVLTLEGPIYELDDEVFFRVPDGLLPGFRFVSPISFQWKSATAATPNLIISAQFPELSFNLPEPGSYPIDLPFSGGEYEVVPWANVSEFAIESPLMRTVFKDQCFIYDEEIYLEAQLQNLDNFDSVSWQDERSYWNTLGFYTDSGHYIDLFLSRAYDVSGNKLDELGPGQNIAAYVVLRPTEYQLRDYSNHGMLKEDGPLFLALQTNVYDLSECTIYGWPDSPFPSSN